LSAKHGGGLAQLVGFIRERALCRDARRIHHLDSDGAGAGEADQMRLVLGLAIFESGVGPCEEAGACVVAQPRESMKAASESDRLGKDK